MLKAKTCFATVGFVVFLIAIGSAYAVPAYPVLTHDDLSHFCDTFPSIYRELRSSGLKFNPTTGAVHGVEQLRKLEKVNKVLERYDWTLTFFPKMRAILKGYALERYRQIKRTHGDNLDRALGKIEKNPWIDAERKAQVRARYIADNKKLEKIAKRLESESHPKDLETIREYMDRLRIVIGQIKGEKRLPKPN